MVHRIHVGGSESLGLTSKLSMMSFKPSLQSIYEFCRDFCKSAIVTKSQVTPESRLGLDDWLLHGDFGNVLYSFFGNGFNYIVRDVLRTK